MLCKSAWLSSLEIARSLYLQQSLRTPIILEGFTATCITVTPLCVLYPTKYPSLWWIVKQIIKGMWTDLAHHFSKSHGLRNRSSLCQFSPNTVLKRFVSEVEMFKLLRWWNTHELLRCHQRKWRRNLQNAKPTFRETVPWIKPCVRARRRRKVVSNSQEAWYNAFTGYRVAATSVLLEHDFVTTKFLWTD